MRRRARTRIVVVLCAVVAGLLVASPARPAMAEAAHYIDGSSEYQYVQSCFTGDIEPLIISYTGYFGLVDSLAGAAFRDLAGRAANPSL